MTLQSSGTLWLSQINTEFGYSAGTARAMSQLYRNGGIVSSGNTNVPTGGAIRFSNFYGARRSFAFGDRHITGDTSNYNLYWDLRGLGWDGVSPAIGRIIIDSGVVVSATDTSHAGFDTGGDFPSGSSIDILNYGYIVGEGGTSGIGEVYYLTSDGKSYTLVEITPVASGGNGGTALNYTGSGTTHIGLYNYGIIAGGGGGGGGARGSNNAVLVNGQTYRHSASGGGGRSGRTPSLAVPYGYQGSFGGPGGAILPSGGGNSGAGGGWGAPGGQGTIWPGDYAVSNGGNGGYWITNSGGFSIYAYGSTYGPAA